MGKPKRPRRKRGGNDFYDAGKRDMGEDKSYLLPGYESNEREANDRAPQQRSKRIKQAANRARKQGYVIDPDGTPLPIDADGSVVTSAGLTFSTVEAWEAHQLTLAEQEVLEDHGYNVDTLEALGRARQRGEKTGPSVVYGLRPHSMGGSIWWDTTTGEHRTSPWNGALQRWGRPRGELDDADGAKWLVIVDLMCARLETVPTVDQAADMLLRRRWNASIIWDDLYRMGGVLGMVRECVTGPESFLTAFDARRERFYVAMRRWVDTERAARKYAAKLAYPVIKHWLELIDLPLREVIAELPNGVMDRRRKPKDMRDLKEHERIPLGAYALWHTEVLRRQSVVANRDRGALV